jgi:hypothetical protein
MNKNIIIYDLEVNPNSFNAFVFFIIFKIHSNLRDYKNLSVIILKPVDKKNNLLDEEKYQFRLDNLIPSIIKLHFGDIEKKIIEDRKSLIPIINNSKNKIYPNGYKLSKPKPYFELKHVINKSVNLRSFKFHLAENAKETVNSWISTQCTNTKANIVTIAIRSTNYQLERNSNLTEWKKVAKKISSQGFLVIFIPDIESDDEFKNLRQSFLFYDLASEDLQIRMALYEKSYLNLVINHGPSSICLFNPNCSYLYFKPIVDAVQCASLDSLEKQGWMPGEQWPGAACHQKIIWYRDDSFIILLAFEAFVDLKEARQVSPIKRKLKSKINTLLEDGDYTTAEKYLIVFDSMFDEPDFSSLNLFKLYCKRGNYRYAFFFAKKVSKNFAMKELQMHIPKGLRKLLPIFINKGNEWDKTFQNHEDIVGNFDKSLKYHIHGTGFLAKKTYEYLNNLISISGFTDNNQYNQLRFNGLDVLNPKSLIDRRDIVIIVASQFYKDIVFTLLAIGFSSDSIAISKLDPNV